VDISQIGDTLRGLTAAAPRLRAALGKEIRTKYTPELEFKADSGVLQGERIEALLRKLGDDGESTQVEVPIPDGGEQRG
jgi:ribosome-binding factor A